MPSPTCKSTRPSIRRRQGNSRPGQLLAFAIGMACLMIGTTTTATAASAQPNAPHSSAQPAGPSLTMWAPLPEFSTPGFDNLISRFDKLTGNIGCPPARVLDGAGIVSELDRADLQETAGRGGQNWPPAAADWME